MGREWLSTMHTQERHFKCPLHQDNKAKCETHTVPGGKRKVRTSISHNNSQAILTTQSSFWIPLYSATKWLNIATKLLLKKQKSPVRKTLEKLNLDSSENSCNETSWKSRKGKCKMLSSQNCFKERRNTLILKEVSFFLLKFYQSFSCPRQLQYLSESHQNKGRRLFWWWKYYSKKEATELGWG